MEAEGRRTSAARQLGDALRELQRRSGRTLRSLESEVMASDSSLSRYLQGRTVPPWATVRDLCRALGADPTEYRALWEAADRCQPPPPAGPEPAGTARAGRRRRRDAAAAWARGRWAWAVAGACAGLLCGGALVWSLPLPHASHTEPGASAARGAQKPSANGPGATRAGEHSRIFVNRVTGRCLDHSLDQGLRSFEPNGLSYQRWTVRPLPDGTSELRNHATGACLEGGPSGLRGASCSGAASQKWLLTAQPDASVRIGGAADGTCLDDGPQGLRAVPCDASDRQKWG
ncbi:XRE family transcriptional regulator [Streptomyces polychromogenes]|nr:XRE family transcriptional regulator [Streptomyces polychromogenes]